MLASHLIEVDWVHLQIQIAEHDVANVCTGQGQELNQRQLLWFKNTYASEQSHSKCCGQRVNERKGVHEVETCRQCGSTPATQQVCADDQPI